MRVNDARGNVNAANEYVTVNRVYSRGQFYRTVLHPSFFLGVIAARALNTRMIIYFALSILTRRT